MGIDFVAFLILLVISIVISAILHFGVRLYVRPDLWSFISKVVVGYIGAWLGTPVFGTWFPGVSYGPVYIIPAIIGSFALLVFAIDVAKMFGGRSN